MRNPRPSEFDAEIGGEIARIEKAILTADGRLIHEEYCTLQGALKRIVALTKRARRQAGRGLLHRAGTWQSNRLAGAEFR